MNYDYSECKIFLTFGLLCVYLLDFFNLLFYNELAHITEGGDAIDRQS